MTRLIDADKLQKAIGSYVVDDRKLSFNQLYENEELLKVFELVGAMPTVDAVPVKHGKWIHYYDIEEGRALRCSECKMVFWVGDGREGNFCPNCGAKMDGEKEE